jgi:hypothetical protein
LGPELEEPGHVVQGGEEQDGEDVEPGLDVVPETEEGSADGNVSGSREHLLKGEAQYG